MKPNEHELKDLKKAKHDQSKSQQFRTAANQGLLNKNARGYSAFQIDAFHKKEFQQNFKLQPPEEAKQNCYPKCLSCIGQCITPLLACLPCCKCYCCCTNLPLFQQETLNFGILQKWGSYERLLNPGLNIINPISQRVIQINRQTKTIKLRQIAFSKDNVQFQVESIIFYRIIDSLKLIYKLGTTESECQQCVAEIAQACLRNIIGLNTLQSAIQTRELIGKSLKQDLNKNLSIWGIYVEACNLKQIILSPQIKDYLESTARAQRQMKAQIINYQAQVKVGLLIKEMSEILSTRAAFQIRYLDTIGSILKNNDNSVIMLRTDIDEGTKSVNVFVNPIDKLKKLAE